MTAKKIIKLDYLLKLHSKNLKSKRFLQNFSAAGNIKIIICEIKLIQYINEIFMIIFYKKSFHSKRSCRQI